jgi:hypothetical protein
LYTASQAQKEKALDRKIGVTEKQAQIEAGLEQARTQAAATLGKATDLDKQTRINYEAMIEAGKPANKATMAAAAKSAADQLGKFAGSDRAEVAANKAMAPELESALMRNKDYQKAMKENRYDDAANIRAQIVSSIKPADKKDNAAPSAAVTIGNQTYSRPANFTDAQWEAYKKSQGVK